MPATRPAPWHTNAAPCRVSTDAARSQNAGSDPQKKIREAGSGGTAAAM